MRYMFPFRKVKKDSRIILYGAGMVGKEFYLQIMYSQYCQMIAWTDQKFNSCVVNSPFIKVEDVIKYEFDYIVIAVEKKSMADAIFSDLAEKNISVDKLVWSRNYFMSGKLLPDSAEMLAQNWDFYAKLLNKAVREESEYIGDSFYQSFDKIGIYGKRNVTERIKTYCLPDYLKSTDHVLNIGCNCGFLDCQAAALVKSWTALDINSNLIDIAKHVSDFVGIKNITFIEADAFGSKYNWATYDAILCLAVYAYILRNGVAPIEFVDKLYSHLSPGGFLWFESHPLVTKQFIDEFIMLCDLFVKKGMEICKEEDLDSGGERKFVILRRPKI